jgi:hypothetical protein
MQAAFEVKAVHLNISSDAALQRNNSIGAALQRNIALLSKSQDGRFGEKEGGVMELGGGAAAMFRGEGGEAEEYMAREAGEGKLGGKQGGGGFIGGNNITGILDDHTLVHEATSSSSSSLPSSWPWPLSVAERTKKARRLFEAAGSSSNQEGNAKAK